MAWNPPYNPNYSYPSAAGQYPYSNAQSHNSFLPPGYPASFGSQSNPPGFPAGSTLPPGYPSGTTLPTSPRTSNNDSHRIGLRDVLHTLASGILPVPNRVGQQHPAPANYSQSAYPPNSTPYSAAGQHLYPQIPVAVAPYYNPVSRGNIIGFVTEPTETEIRQRRVEFKYSSASDIYVRTSDNNRQISGWQSAVYAEENIMRKEEHDWKKTYLARRPGTSNAFIEWRFDLTRSGQRVRKLHVQFPTKHYEDGSIYVYILTDKGETIRLGESERCQEMDQRMRGVSRFSLVAELTHGVGENAWQHTQIFRQDMRPGFFASDDSMFSFKIAVDME